MDSTNEEATNHHDTKHIETNHGDTKHGDLDRLFALGSLSLIGVTWPLWLPHSAFPQVPLVSVAARCPHSFEWGVLAVWLGSLISLIFVSQRKYRSPICLIATIAALTLVAIDQHRLQPWVYQFLIVSLVLALADSDTACAAWRWLIIGIYAWSAWSKTDYGFLREHGPFLLDGLCRSLGITSGVRTWPESVQFGTSAMIPLFEFAVAIGLRWKPTRRYALVGAAMMHVSLLLALGPFGHQHQPGVLVWNVFFLIQNDVLFHQGPRFRWIYLRNWGHRRAAAIPAVAKIDVTTQRLGNPPKPASLICEMGNALAWCVVFGALFWPILEPMGFCDHWPAWAVYAAKPERVIVFISPDEFSKLPDDLQQHIDLQTSLDHWHPIRIDRWSLESVRVPIYPQDRFHVGVAMAIARDFELAQIRVVIFGPANRWTGKRTFREYYGDRSLEDLAKTFRLNAKPR